MSAGQGESSPRGACEQCLRRGWLLARLSPLLDRCAPDRERLFALLELADCELIEALAGSRRASTHAAYAAFEPSMCSSEEGLQRTCRHSRGHPSSLRDAGAAALLHVAGPRERLGELTEAPVVAVLGCERASDYGVEFAAAFARELSACGVTVLACARPGIGGAALAGAVQAGSHCVALFGDGLRCARGSAGRLLAQVAINGCVVSELPAEVPGRLWGRAACERLALELSQLVVLVEGEAAAGEAATVRMASARGIAVGAVPGLVASSLSAAPHALIREGACLIRGAQDALELLYPLGAPTAALAADSQPVLEPLLESVLEEVGSGRDSAEVLARRLERPLAEILLALTQLELLGLLAKGRGGRYLRRVGRGLGAPTGDS